MYRCVATCLYRSSIHVVSSTYRDVSARMSLMYQSCVSVLCRYARIHAGLRYHTNTHRYTWIRFMVVSARTRTCSDSQVGADQLCFEVLLLYPWVSLCISTGFSCIRGYRCVSACICGDTWLCIHRCVSVYPLRRQIHIRYAPIHSRYALSHRYAPIHIRSIRLTDTRKILTIRTDTYRYAWYR